MQVAYMQVYMLMYWIRRSNGLVDHILDELRVQISSQSTQRCSNACMRLLLQMLCCGHSLCAVTFTLIPPMMKLELGEHLDAAGCLLVKDRLAACMCLV